MLFKKTYFDTRVIHQMYRLLKQTSNEIILFQNKSLFFPGT